MSQVALLGGIKSATEPASPAVDQLWYDTTADVFKRWDGSAWVASGSGAYVPLGRPFKAGAFTRFMDCLAEGAQSTALGVIGDSTGYTSGKTRWPYLLDDMLAALFPTYAVQTLTWNEGTQAYDAPVTIAGNPSGRTIVYGGVGAVDHYGNGTAITGNIDIRIKLQFPNWPTTNTGVIASRWTSGQKAWRLYINAGSGGSGEQLTFEWSTNGSTSTAVNSSTLGAAVTAGQSVWIRVTLTASSGAVSFYTSTGGVSWTAQGGSAGAGATSIYDPGTNWPYELFGDSGGANPCDANTAVYEVEVRNGIDGVPVTPRYGDCWVGHDTNATFSYTGSPVLSIVNGSIPGAWIGYLTDSTRFPKLANPSWGTTALILSCSHNDGNDNGYQYAAKWDAWLTQIRAYVKAAEVAVTIQNPKNVAGTTTIADVSAQRVRQHELRVWAARNNLSIIDVYRAYVESSTATASLNDTDGIHPRDGSAGDLTKGSPLWAQTVYSALIGRS